MKYCQFGFLIFVDVWFERKLILLQNYYTTTFRIAPPKKTAALLKKKYGCFFNWLLGLGSNQRPSD